MLKPLSLVLWRWRHDESSIHWKLSAALWRRNSKESLAEVVSDQNYNAELVIDEEEGIVLEVNDVEHLSVAIQRLDTDQQLLARLSKGSYKSSENFYIENYIDMIMKDLM